MSPPTDHARTAADSAGGAGGRTGWPLPVDDTPSSILAPLLSRVPAMSISGIQGISASGISSLKGLGGFLPRPTKLAPVDETSAAWAELALGGQRRQRLLLLTSPTHALQVFAYRPSTIPDDVHVAEPFPPPEEVASIPTIIYEPDAPKSVLQGVRTQRVPGPRRAVSAHLLDRAHWGTRGPVVALITVTAATDVPLGHGHLSLVLLDLERGKAFRRLDLGTGVTASVTSTPRVIVITTSHPTPSIHVLDTNLERVRPPIADLPVHPSTRLPVSSVSGRLLAYATAEPALTPGADGLGSIVAATSARLRASSTSSTHSAGRTPQTTQGALLNSAVEIGGGVARGVWAGLKMGARAAQQASNSRLASSAPNERGLAMPDVEHNVNESRSVEDAVEELPPTGLPGGVWVKIVDLFSVQTGDQADVVAHFRLPPTRLLVPSLPTAQHPRGHPAPREHPIAFLSFSPQGTRLLAAAADGRVFHVLDVRPRGAAVGKQKSPRGEVWDAYVLRRGNTTADVRSVTWSRDERWIAVGTGKGTVHVFPISPAGGKPSAASHVKTKLANPTVLQPLSVEVSPFARLRPLPIAPEEGKEDPNPGAVFAVSVFASTRPHPLDKGTLCQDVAIYRAGVAQLELARLTVHPATPAPTPPEGAYRRRGSNLTEMMREKAGLLPDGDLVVEQAVKARWTMPLGQGPSDGSVQWSQAATAKTTSAARRGNSIYHAEIRTHSTSARILPASIYLARQVEFFAAVPTDEYSPLSVLDKVARTRRLIFRPEVEVHPSTSEAVSFDKPLSSALHSVIEGRPVSQLPQLPNGSPSKGGIFSSIPIRHVAANLGEGVDRVRREYVRQQHSRARRRTSNATSHASNSNSAGVSVSFEDDTVLASRPPSDESEDVASSPSSALSPNTAPNSSLADDDDGWAEPWEDEYARAVADDGGPDDLVLGLLDEEEEERRQWEERQRALASKLARGERGGGGGGGGGGERSKRG